MIYFLYGPDTYSSRQKLYGIIAAFKAKAGGALGLTRIDAESNPEAVLGAGRTASLFSGKELLVIENAGRGSAEVTSYLASWLSAWAEDRRLTVVFWEGSASEKGPALFGEIERLAAKSQEFRPLSSSALGRWLDSEAGKRRLRISAEEKRLLTLRHGPDLWVLSGELAKMESGWRLGPALQEEEKVWGLANAFFSNRLRAFPVLVRLLNSGFEPVYLLGALASSLRRMAAGSGRTAAGQKRISAEFQSLLGTDVELKTGRLPPPLPLIKLVLKSGRTKTPA